MSSLIVPVVRIESLTKVANADTLLVARFKNFGWQSIVKIGQYEVGMMVIFVPPDSILPEWIIEAEKIAYLRNEHGRTRTVKLRGELSEGIVLPIQLLISKTNEVPTLGTNVAEQLGITKWEPPPASYQSGPKPKRDRPYNSRDFPKYVDIENIKNFESVVHWLIGTMIKCRITEKIHGTNFRAGWILKTRLSLWDKILKLFGKFDPWVFTCGSRNVEMGLESEKPTFYGGLGKNIYQQVARQIKDKIPRGYIVYGEIYGEGIQDLTYGIKGIDWALFDIMESETKRYLDYYEARKLSDAWFGPSRFVPVLYTGELTEAVITQFTDGMSILALGKGVYHLREGCVITPLEEITQLDLGRVILKSVSTQYLTRKKGSEYK